MSAIVAPARGQSLILGSVTWKTYHQLLRLLSRHHVRMTFDHGVLEILVLSHEHESYRYLLSRLVDALTEELTLPVKGGGSTTFRKQLRRRGLEPDGSWWIANETRVRGKIEINLKKDPPPDLVLEIDVTHSSLDRMSIYASLRVPEVWRYNGTTLTFHVLPADQKTYTESVTSLAFPGLTPKDIQSHLDLRGGIDENAIVRAFRAWVRANLVGTNPRPAT